MSPEDIHEEAQGGERDEAEQGPAGAVRKNERHVDKRAERPERRHRQPLGTLAIEDEMQREQGEEQGVKAKAHVVARDGGRLHDAAQRGLEEDGHDDCGQFKGDVGAARVVLRCKEKERHHAAHRVNRLRERIFFEDELVDTARDYVECEHGEDNCRQRDEAPTQMQASPQPIDRQ